MIIQFVHSVMKFAADRTWKEKSINPCIREIKLEIIKVHLNQLKQNKSDRNSDCINIKKFSTFLGLGLLLFFNDRERKICIRKSTIRKIYELKAITHVSKPLFQSITLLNVLEMKDNKKCYILH